MYVDIAVAVIFFISVLVSFLRGFIREVLTIAGLIAGIVATFMIGPVLEEPILNWMSSDPENPTSIFGVIPASLFASGLAYGATFITVTLAVSFLTFLLTKGIHEAGLGPINRMLGVLFGAARAALLIALLYLPFYYAEPEDGYSWMSQAHSNDFIRGSAQFVDEQFVDKVFPDSEEEAEDEIQETGSNLPEEQNFFNLGKEIEVERLKDIVNE